MICDLIHERKGLGGRAVGVAIPRIVLEYGREAVVVTIWYTRGSIKYKAVCYTKVFGQG